MTTNRMDNATGAALLVLSGAAEAAYQWNLPTPVTRVAGEIYDLHLIMMAIILVIFVGVFGVMFYSIYAHRKSVGHKAENFHENITVEIIWAIIPFLILIAVAWPATKSILNLKDTASADITIKSTGYQWKWGYDYLKGEGEGVSFLSNLSTPQDQITGKAPKGEHYLLEVDNPMVVPVGKKVRVLITANDVIHAWMVPAYGVACHQANGQGVKGTFPALDGSQLVNGPRGRQMEIVLNGKRGTAMAPFGKQLSDTDIAAVVTYERNAWSNKTGDVIQPSEIRAARE